MNDAQKAAMAELFGMTYSNTVNAYTWVYTHDQHCPKCDSQEIVRMQGLLANFKVAPEDFTKQGMNRFYKTIAHDRVRHADSLIAELEEVRSE